MKLAYTMAPGRGDTDLVLQAVAAALIARGLQPAGCVQVNTARAHDGPCDMDVRVLPNGPVLRISQDLGAGSRGCRLDPSALEQAVAAVTPTLPGADCLIVNKFGKHEAEGRGFRALIAEALAQEIPVLVGVNTLNLPAFLDFSADLAQRLDPTEDALRDWVVAAAPARSRAA